MHHFGLGLELFGQCLHHPVPQELENPMVSLVHGVWRTASDGVKPRPVLVGKMLNEG
jgi:hypothetical protein